MSSRVFSLFYSVALFPLYIGISLRDVLFFLCGKKESFSWRKKIFFPLFGKDSFPLRDAHRPLLWIHAASVGETKVGQTFYEGWKKLYPEAQCVISSITKAGHESAQKAFPQALFHLFLPLDFPLFLRPLLRHFSPQWVVICETDFWFHFQKMAREQGAKLFLINGKISTCSMKRYKWVPSLTSALFGSISLFCVQDEEMAVRFSQLGVISLKVVVTGNLKLSYIYPKFSVQEKAKWRKRCAFCRKDQILTVGSSHFPEEKRFIAVFKELWKEFPHFKCFLAPRHCERTDEISAFLKREKIPHVRFSELSEEINSLSPPSLILVDRMGQLLSCYALSKAAIVGGTYTSCVGGHNLIEPVAYSIPVFYGPYIHAQKELHRSVQQYEVGKQVELCKLSEELRTLFLSSELQKNYRSRSLLFVRASKNQLKNTIKAIKNHLV